VCFADEHFSEDLLVNAENDVLEGGTLVGPLEGHEVENSLVDVLGVVERDVDY